MNDVDSVTGVAAGVPFVAVPPATARPATPVVVAWHMMDAPRTEAAFAASIPLDGLDAWRIYLGLPMCGSRLPDGGLDEIMRLGYEDAVVNIQYPVATQAADEFPAALAELRSTFAIGDDAPIGVIGASIGAAPALLVMAESDVRVDAAVLISPVVQLRSAVDAVGRRFGVTYPWSDRTLAMADRLDFVARADDLAKAGPAVCLVVGEKDDSDGFRQPAEALRDSLASRYDDATRADLVIVPGMAHALAEEPGLEPAPQTAHAAQVDQHAVRWLQQHLMRS